jgi:hypothetical protein
MGSLGRYSEAFGSERGEGCYESQVESEHTTNYRFLTRTKEYSDAFPSIALFPFRSTSFGVAHVKAPPLNCETQLHRYITSATCLQLTKFCYKPIRNFRVSRAFLAFD